jgi:hypothetical protein
VDNWETKPNYTKKQFKRLYRIHRQIKNPSWKKDGIFDEIYNNRNAVDETLRKKKV